MATMTMAPMTIQLRLETQPPWVTRPHHRIRPPSDSGDTSTTDADGSTETSSSNDTGDTATDGGGSSSDDVDGGATDDGATDDGAADDATEPVGDPTTGDTCAPGWMIDCLGGCGPTVYIGDAFCDDEALGPSFACDYFDWDGGDCDMPFDPCTEAGSTPEWLGDGDCDASNNVEACSYYDGDCCESTCSPDADEPCGAAGGFDCLDPDATDFEGDDGTGDDGTGDDGDPGSEDGTSIYGLTGGCTIVDGKNTDGGYTPGMGTDGHIMAFKHVVDADLSFNAIQVHTGERTRGSRAAIWTDSFDTPDFELTGGDFLSVEAIGWQGTRLDAPVDLSAGEHIWVTWHTHSGLPSWAGAGESGTHMWSLLGGSGDWNGPYSGYDKFRLLYCDDAWVDDATGDDDEEIEVDGYTAPHEGVMVKIPAQTFEMGCTESMASLGTCYPDESPAHTVTLTNDFYIGQTEVTQGQYTEIMGTNPSYFSHCGPNCPVEMITWHMAAAFANAVSEMEGLETCFECTGEDGDTYCTDRMNPYSCSGYRLSTEAEWEAAGRCGGDLPFASASTELDALDVAWTVENAMEMPQDVGTKNPNSCGLYDMTGNIQEWNWDLYSWDSYEDGDEIDPFGTELEDGDRSNRGGNFTWSIYSSCCGLGPTLRTSMRNYASSTYFSYGMGFRLARTSL